jgi:protocatechuate 3,4-dioxygenase beta subunit
LTGPDGPAANLGIRLVPANFDDFTSDSGMEVAQTVTTEQGQFTLLAVPPGAYVIRVLRVPRPAPTNPMQGPNGPMLTAPRPPPAAPTEPTLYAQMPIAVSDADLAGLSVPLRIGPRVSGRVEFDGTPSNPSAPRTPQITVNLMPADGRFVSGGLMPAVANADGQFTTMSVPPGRYLITASAPGWILKSATVNGRDASEIPIDLETNDIGGVTLTLFNRPAQLSGTVHDARGNPDEAASVLLFPADYRSWIQEGMNNRRLRATRSAANGRFSMGGLVPGDYLLIAVNDAVTDRPEGIEAVASLAVRISLSESTNQTHDLTTVQVPIR